MKLNIIIISILIHYTTAFAADPFVNVKKIMIVGNSISYHQARPSLKWNGNYGMAATEKSKDYVHLILSALDKLYPTKKHEASIFRIKDEGKMTGYDYLLKQKADLIIVLLSENYQGKYNDEELRKPYEQMLKAFKKHITPNIICVGAWGYNLERVKLRCKMMETAARNQNIPFVFIGDLGCKENAAYTDPKFSDYPHAVKWHPSDIGMRLIAERILTLSHNKDTNDALLIPKTAKVIPYSLDNHAKVSDLKFPEIFPAPREVQFSSNIFLCPDKVSIFEQNDTSIVSKELSNILLSKWGVGSNMDTGSSYSCQVFRFEISNNSDLPKSAQGYTLTIDTNNVIVKARTKQGLFYGMQTLGEMIRSSSHNRILKACVIRDWPACKMRGCYLSLTSIKVSEQTLPALKKLIDVFASLKINALVVEIAGNMRYEKEKFIKESPFSKEQVADLVAYAKSRYFEVIPYLQVMSHARWASSHPGYKQLLEDPKFATSWNAAFCSSNPNVDKFIENIITENIEVFKPNYFHLGFDEVYLGPFKQCPKCIDQEASKLFLAQINKSSAILKMHKVTPIIYHDSFLPEVAIPGNPIPVNENLVNDKVEGWKIVNKLDKNTVINIWDYKNEPNKSLVDYFSKMKFPVLAATSCTDGLLNNQNFSRLLELYPNSLGIIMTYWFHAKDWTNPLKGLSRQALAGTLLMAQYSWNPHAIDVEHIKYDPLYEMQKRIASDSQNILSPVKYIPINLDRFSNINFGHIENWPRLEENDTILKGWKKSLATLPEKFNLVQMSKTSFKAIVLSGREGDGLPISPVTIPLNIRANALTMLHVTSRPKNVKKYTRTDHVKHTPKIGEYIIHYMDGSTANIPLIYRVNIVDWNAPLSGIDCRKVLYGHDAAGNFVSFVKSKWVNPSPEKVIRNIVFRSFMCDGIAPALLGITASRNITPFRPLINFNSNTLSSVNISLNNGKLENVSLLKTSHDAQDILKITIPASKTTLRLLLDIPITEDLSLLKQIKLAVRISTSPALKLSGIYLGNDANYSSYWVQYRFIDIKSTDWQRIDCPISAMSIKEASGFAMNKFKYMRISFWIQSDKKTEVYLKSLKWSSNDNSETVLRKKLTD